MSALHVIIASLPSFCHKLLKLVEIWRSSYKKKFAQFFSETRCMCPLQSDIATVTVVILQQWEMRARFWWQPTVLTQTVTFHLTDGNGSLLHGVGCDWYPLLFWHSVMESEWNHWNGWVWLWFPFQCPTLSHRPADCCNDQSQWSNIHSYGSPRDRGVCLWLSDCWPATEVSLCPATRRLQTTHHYSTYSTKYKLSLNTKSTINDANWSNAVQWDWLTELRFYIPIDTKQVILETFPKPISWLSMVKLNLTQQKHAFTNQKKCTTTQNRQV